MSDDRPSVTDEIELLDVAMPAAASTVSEMVTNRGPKRNGLAIVVALAVAAVGVSALATSGSDQAAPPTTPPTTLPTTSTTEPATTERRADGALSAVIGAGPSLIWQPIDFEIDATSFEWVDGSFFATGGTNDVLIQPGPSGAGLTLFGTDNESINRSIQSGTAVFGRSPTNPDVLVFPTESSFEAIEITPISTSGSDLVELSTALAVERIGDRVLVLQSTITVLDVDRFRSRTATDIDPIFDVTVDQFSLIVRGNDLSERLTIADLDLSADDLDALRTLGESVQVLSVGQIGAETQQVGPPISRIDWIAVVNEEFVVGGNELWRSSDGTDWQQSLGDTPQFGGLNPPGPDGVLTGLAFEGDAGFLTFSISAGRSWSRLSRPMENTWTIDSAAPVIAMTGWQEEPFVPGLADWVVLTPKFELRIGGDDDSFELLDRSGVVILSGDSGDPSSGFRFVPGSPDVWFVDPTSGEEIARFPQSLFASAFAAARTLEGQAQMVAFADVSESIDDTVEWSLTRVNELFGPDALAVDFVPGAGWFLADVTTTTGRELYLAEIPTSRPPSSRRHPTRAEISQLQAERD